MVEHVPDAKIAAALQWHLGQMASLLPTAWPGANFTPPADGKYLQALFLPNRPPTPTIPFDEVQARQGLFQVSVFWPVGEFLAAPLAMADRVRAHFARGTVITRDGIAVRIIEEPWASSPITEAHRLQIPVTVPWRVL
jgi:hypothetical protein